MKYAAYWQKINNWIIIKKTRRNYIKQLNGLIVALLIIILFLLLPVSSAKYVGAYNVKITKDYVKSTSKCSCSLSSDYKYHEQYFKNYCPNCHLYGTINFEQGLGEHNPEGMWYCTNCDIDFCLVHGKSHDHRKLYLIKTENCDTSEKINYKDLDTIKFPKKFKWQNRDHENHFTINFAKIYEIRKLKNNDKNKYFYIK